MWIKSLFVIVIFCYVHPKFFFKCFKIRTVNKTDLAFAVPVFNCNIHVHSKFCANKDWGSSFRRKNLRTYIFSQICSTEWYMFKLQVSVQTIHQIFCEILYKHQFSRKSSYQRLWNKLSSTLPARFPGYVSISWKLTI